MHGGSVININQSIEPSRLTREYRWRLQAGGINDHAWIQATAKAQSHAAAAGSRRALQLMHLKDGGGCISRAAHAAGGAPNMFTSALPCRRAGSRFLAFHVARAVKPGSVVAPSIDARSPGAASARSHVVRAIAPSFIVRDDATRYAVAGLRVQFGRHMRWRQPGCTRGRSQRLLALCSSPHAGRHHVDGVWPRGERHYDSNNTLHPRRCLGCPSTAACPRSYDELLHDCPERTGHLHNISSLSNAF